MRAATPITTFLFTDIENSTRLWEEQPERMQAALKSHDLIGRKAVSDHRGTLVKTTGDGLYAVFDDPLDAIAAVIQFQLGLADTESVPGLALRARCGLHAGVDEHRDKDFFGRDVNRAARIMSAAHGGQVLVSQAVALLTRDRLPAGVELRDLGAVRLRDLATPERLYQLQHPRLRDTFPALRSLETVPNNLPQQLTSFVGRDRALDEVDELLQHTRLLTLFGTGGIGKTRLALQLAARVLDRYPDGVWFVELAPLSDQRLVLQAIASVLGVKEDPGRPLIDAVLSHVRDSHAPGRARQLRAPGGGLRRTGPRVASGRPGDSDPRLEPGATACRRRSDIPCSFVADPGDRGKTDVRVSFPVRIGSVVRGARNGGTPVVRSQRPDRRADCRDLPPPRRNSARH